MPNQPTVGAIEQLYRQKIADRMTRPWTARWVEEPVKGHVAYTRADLARDVECMELGDWALLLAGFSVVCSVMAAFGELALTVWGFISP